MKGSVNKTILVGNCGRAPEMRYTPNGTAIADVSVATTYSRKKPEGGYEDQTEWHNVKFIGKSAELAGQLLYKGAKVYIEGRGQTDSWDHKDYPNVKMYRHQIIVNTFEVLSKLLSDEEKESVDIPLEPHSSVRDVIDGAPPPIDDFEDYVPF